VRRAALIAALMLALALALAPAAQAETASLPDLEDEVMCPICGTTLQLSDSPQAEREKQLIRDLIAKGDTKQQVKDELVREYGPDVLATPGDSGFDLTAWLLPIVGLALGLIGIGVALWRWRGRGGHGEPPAPGPEGEEAERLDADLARYDL
jgi:cytochrome c-type biogenesis protein CcmH